MNLFLKVLFLQKEIIINYFFYSLLNFFQNPLQSIKFCYFQIFL